MLTLVYFASIREQLGVDSEQFELPDDVTQVNQLLQVLLARGDAWQRTLSATNLLVAVNQEMSALDAAIADGDEVAFFPPVTGG